MLGLLQHRDKGLHADKPFVDARAHGGNHGAYKRLGKPQATAPPQDPSAF